MTDLGIIIFTDDKFDIEAKFCFLLRCVNSIRRQKQNNVKIVFLSKTEIDEQYRNQFPDDLQVKVVKTSAAGMNECIRELDCSHFLFVRYDTIFSQNSLAQITSLEKDEGLIFNYSYKTSRNEFELAPFYNNVNFVSQFERLPFALNIVFSKSVLLKNNIRFSDFKYSDQYLFILNYYTSSKNIKCSNDVLLCLDRTLNIEFKFSNSFFYKNYKNIFKVAKRLRKAREIDIIGYLMRDLAVPLLKRRYSEKSMARRMFNLFVAKYLMRILFGF